MTIENDMYKQIRRLYVAEGMSQRKISRVLGIGRNTVKKYCTGAVSPDTPKKVMPQERTLRKAVEPHILRYLEENISLPRKQRMSAINMWERLRKEECYDIAASTVRKYVNEIRNENPDSYIPLSYAPGEIMQIDWGDADVYFSNVKTSISIFCGALPYSFGIHASVFPNKTMESFFMGHIQAFEFVGGVPRKCIYDNLKTAVASGSGQQAVQQERFNKLTAHYAFEAEFCNVAAGWD